MPRDLTLHKKDINRNSDKMEKQRIELTHLNVSQSDVLTVAGSNINVDTS